MDSEPVLTRTAKIWLREDGLVQAVTLPGTQEELKDAQDNLAVIAGFASDKKRPVLIDMRAMTRIEREARIYYATGGGRLVVTAVALLISSPVSRVIANFAIAVTPPPVPMRLFTSEAEAVVWLKNFIE